MKLKTMQHLLLLLFILLGSWATGTGILLYKLPDLITNRISKIQIRQAGALDQWLHKRATVDHRFQDVVRPNVDTIYSSVFADLSKGPYVLEIPEIEKYWSVGFYAENTTNFKIISIRTHGNSSQVKTILVPDGYEGDTMGMEVVEAPGDLVWVLIRLRIEGKHDESRIHGIQDQIRFIPVSEYQAT